jgi:hypothetical protein
VQKYEAGELTDEVVDAVRIAAERVGHLFIAIQEAAARKDPDRLITDIDRLQREVGAGNAMLDRTLDRKKA